MISIRGLTIPLAKLPVLIDHLRHASFLGNFFTVAGASALSNLIGLITLGYTARVLGPDYYGLTVFGVSVVTYAGTIMSPGFFKWGTRAIAQDRNHAGEIIGTIIMIQTALACLSFSGVLLYSVIFLEESERLIVILYGFTLFVTAIGVEWVYYGLELMRVSGWFTVLNSILNAAGLLLLIRQPDHIYRLPLLVAIVPLLSQAGLYLLLFKRFGIVLHLPSSARVKSALIASIPLGSSAILSVISTYANNLFIKSYLGTASVGIYYAAYRLMDLSVVVMVILSLVFSPRLSRLVAVDLNAARREALLFLRSVVTMSFLFAPIVFTEAGDIVFLVYGSNYAEAVSVLRILSLAIIFGPANACYIGSLIPFHEDWVMFRVISICAAIMIVGGTIFIPTFGVTGAAWTFVIVSLVGALLPLPTYRRAVCTMGFSEWRLPIVGGLAVVATGFVLQNTGLVFWFRVPIEILVYAPFALLNMRQLLTALWPGLESRA